MTNQNKIFKDSAIVLLLTLFSKGVGFVKSIFQASYLGATIETDAFNVSNGFVGNVLYMLTLSIAVAFVPQYTQHKLQGEENAKKYGTRVITALMLASILLVALLELAAPLIVRIIAPAYSGETLDLTIRFFRVLVLGFSFSLGANIYTNLLNSERIYGYSSLCSIINSIVLIIFILTLSNTIGVWCLVLSVPASYFVQWLFLYFKGRRFARLSFQYGIRDEAIIRLLVIATPVLVSQATVEINQVVDKALLTSVGAGALTAVSYAAVLYQFASTLISAPLSSVMFTELSDAGAKNEGDRIKLILNRCYRIVLIVCIPVTCVTLLCSSDIVQIVYGHGNYDSTAISNTAIGLFMYGLCVFPVCIKTVLSRAYYSLNDTKRPMVIGVIEVICNISLSILFVKPFGLAGVVGATAIASYLAIVIMLFDFNTKHIKVIDKQSIKTYYKIIFSLLVCIIVAILLSKIPIHNFYFSFCLKTLAIIISHFFLLVVIRETSTIGILKFATAKLKKFIRHI